MKQSHKPVSTIQVSLIFFFLELSHFPFLLLPELCHPLFFLLLLWLYHFCSFLLPVFLVAISLAACFLAFLGTFMVAADLLASIFCLLCLLLLLLQSLSSLPQSMHVSIAGTLNVNHHLIFKVNIRVTWSPGP